MTTNPRNQPKYRPDISEAQAVQQASMLKAIADPTRLRLLDLMKHHGGRITVEEMVECFHLAQPSISHHIRILRTVGLVTYHKEHVYRYYRLNEQGMKQVQGILDVVMGTTVSSPDMLLD